MGRATIACRVLTISSDRRIERPDTLIAEEPLEIRIGGHPVSVTMRIPGDDFDLVAGFLVTEGVIGSAADLTALRYCAGAGADGVQTYNVVDAALGPGVPSPALTLERNFVTASSCGLCGKASIEAIRTRSRWQVTADPVQLVPEILAGLPAELRRAQSLFTRTGGLHAAGLFDAAGRLRCLREDVGRHNAVDKVVGHALRSGLLPLRGHLLLVSGRASFELTQKALMAGIPVLAAVSAPSALAVELAREAGMTLVGFLREGSMNVYTGSHRLTQ